MRCGGVVRNLVSMAVVTMLALAGCASEAAPPPERAEPPTTAATEEPTTTSSTTTTTEPATDFEPLMVDPDQSVGDQIEAAYLFHWEVLLDAYRSGRTDNLDLVYAEEALEHRIGEIEGLVADGHRVGGHVEHNYEITLVEPGFAVVMDRFRNFLVLVDPTSGEPLGDPSGREVLYEYELRLRDSRWIVVRTA